MVFVEVVLKSNWITNTGGYSRKIPPIDWITYHKESLDIDDSNRNPVGISKHLAQHYKLYNTIVDWIFNNITDSINNVWWDCDGDRMYFAFKKPEHYTWFLLRWENSDE